jgi:hypothetical protein
VLIPTAPLPIARRLFQEGNEQQPKERRKKKGKGKGKGLTTKKGKGKGKRKLDKPGEEEIEEEMVGWEVRWALLF